MEVQIPLVLFTLFMCLSCGLMGFQGLMLAMSKGTNKFHLVTLISAFVAMAVGGIAVFTHLQHWERIFNGFGHITSGITHELILVVVMVIAFIVLFVMLWKGREDGKVPGKALGIVFIVIALVGGFVCAHSYDMYARPAWSNVFLYLYYYSSELILGVTGIWVLTAALKEPLETNGLFGKLTLVIAAISAVVVIAAIVYIANIQVDTIDGITFYTYDPTHAAADPASDLAAPLSGDSAPLFWGGVVVVGCAIPALVGLLAAAKKQLASNIALPVVALLTAIAGGVCYRVVLYVVGIASYVYFF